MLLARAERLLQEGDPAYNVNLSLDRADFMRK